MPSCPLPGCGGQDLDRRSPRPKAAHFASLGAQTKACRRLFNAATAFGKPITGKSRAEGTLRAFGPRSGPGRQGDRYDILLPPAVGFGRIQIVWIGLLAAPPLHPCGPLAAEVSTRI